MARVRYGVLCASTLSKTHAHNTHPQASFEIVDIGTLRQYLARELSPPPGACQDHNTAWNLEAILDDWIVLYIHGLAQLKKARTSISTHIHTHTLSNHSHTASWSARL